MNRYEVAAVVLVVGVVGFGALSDTTIQWDEARDHIGDEREVCGEIASVRPGDGSATLFFNLGLDYPDPDRFTIVVFEEFDPSADLDEVIGGTICAEGKIVEYEGSAQIHLDSFGDISVPEREDEESPHRGPRVGY